jgi:hypothetical protein
MMNLARGPLVLGVCVTLGLAALTAGQDVAPAAPRLTYDEMAAFLLKARILNVRDAGSGVTGSQRARLSDGQLTHDAHIQSVDIARPVFEAGAKTELNFKDTYRFNIAGYRLARLIGLDTVPMSVERAINGKASAVTWWVDDVLMDEKARTAKKTAGPDPQRTAKQIQVMRIWDELIQNKDRNQGNILWTHDWTMWLIDHTRAFRLGKELLKPEELTRCERGLLERLRGLTEQSVAEAVGRSLTKDERAAVLARRDRIVKLYDDRIAKIGDAGVLFTM